MKELERKNAEIKELQTKVDNNTFRLLKRISALETIKNWPEYSQYISFNNRGDICYNNRSELHNKVKEAKQFNSFEDFYNHLNKEKLNNLIIELKEYK